MSAETIFQSLQYLEFYPHLTNGEEGGAQREIHNSQLQSSLTMLSFLRWGWRGRLRALAEFLVQRQRLLTKGLKPNPGAAECFPSPTPHHHIAKELFTTTPFAQYLMFSYHKEITRHYSKAKSHFEETARIRRRLSYGREVGIP